MRPSFSPATGSRLHKRWSRAGRLAGCPRARIPSLNPGGDLPAAHLPAGPLDIHEEFPGLACAIICWRSLTNLTLSGAVSRLIVCANAGLTGTALRRKMMDADAMRLGLENTTTARDQATLLDAIAWRDLLPAPLRAFALQALERQQLNEGLPALLPDDVIVAHKTGTLPGVQHDVGIITGANGREAVVAALLSGLEARPLNLPSDGSALPACPPAPSVALAAVGFAAWRALGGSVSSTRYTRCHSQPEDGMILPAATTLHGKHDEH